MDVEIWSDIACPWCYIGKRRFEAALAEFEHRDDVRVTWRSFELDPSAPHEREGDRATRLAEKYGITVDRAKELEHTVTDAAAGEGLDFRFDIQRSGTTFDGHRVALTGLATDNELLLLAYFTEGQLMSDPETLVRLAVEVGLDADEVRQMLASDRFADEVRGDERLAGQFGISAVPTFVVDRAIGASGAHPPEALIELLRQGWERRSPVTVIAGGETCDVDGNC